MATAAHMPEPAPQLRFKFDELRSTQAAAVLIRLAGGRQNYTKLLKLLYLADRAALLDHGSPITGSTQVVMRAGPLSSEVYDFIKRVDLGPVWHKHIATDEYEVKLVTDPGDSELSDFDVETLTALHQEHALRDRHSIVRFVHTLPEIASIDSGSLPLSDVEILRVAGGVDDATIRQLASHHGYLAAFDSWVDEQRGDRTG